MRDENSKSDYWESFSEYFRNMRLLESNTQKWNMYDENDLISFAEYALNIFPYGYKLDLKDVKEWLEKRNG